MMILFDASYTVWHSVKGLRELACMMRPCLMEHFQSLIMSGYHNCFSKRPQHYARPTWCHTAWLLSSTPNTVMHNSWCFLSTCCLIPGYIPEACFPDLHMCVLIQLVLGPDSEWAPVACFLGTNRKHVTLLGNTTATCMYSDVPLIGSILLP